MAKAGPNLKRPSLKRQRAEKFGRQMEDSAAAFMQSKGYVILESRYKTQHGEIDLIAEKSAMIIFVEVKARAKKTDLAMALEAINQTRIANAAELWVAKNPELAMRDMRFDVILLTPNQQPYHLENAFMGM